MIRVIAGVVASLLLVGCTAGRAGPGSVGVGDPYAPDAGNGGYHVIHYDLDLAYQPKGDHLSGVATLIAKATQDLNRL